MQSERIEAGDHEGERGPTPELVVRLTARERRAARHWFVRAFWERAEKELLAADALRPAAPTNRWCGIASPDGVTVTYDAAPTHHAPLRELIDSAERSITLASYGFGANHPLLVRLGERARAGLRVRVLAPLREKITPTLGELVEVGAEVAGVDRLHAKAISIDDGRAAWVGSANLERIGLDDGFELGVLLDDARASATDRILTSWWVSAAWRLRTRLRLGEAAPRSVVGRFVRGRFEKVRIEATRFEDAGVQSADYRPPQSTAFGADGAAHRSVVRWQVKTTTFRDGVR